MNIDAANLRSLYTGFSAAFQGGFAGVTPNYTRVATVVPSTTKSNEYGWLGDMPRIREWIGDRVVNDISTAGYTIKNKSFESTVGVDQDDIDDDNIGLYTPLFTELGRSSATFPDELVWPLLKAGFSTTCFDKQYFFDTDHPVLDADGATINSVANTDGGAGAPWFLLDTSRALKPVIFQKRKEWRFTRMDNPNDEGVFSAKKIRYGIDSRCNVGFGFWQMAWGSKQTLDTTHFETAVAAMQSFKGDYGRPLGIQPDLLVVPPSLGAAAKNLLLAANLANGASNVNFKAVDMMVVPWLA
ncbi:Mu-like prophage major head subunit gpT family protein [Zavarzinia aquatilis]|uniref:Bacteriophage Mu GpT domain-containing protein n=1 Tax=Zavarzinia aquatilis TaxID=2211142 RepID=A0A317DUI7_9PROT|nr:Mu-like prophage major head subunit gpT family protein [Zavarzinia aquatilis]PWR17640.1 hypothetical protein DKG74_20745 [Zavarzinia aquatilis]